MVELVGYDVEDMTWLAVFYSKICCIFILKKNHSKNEKLAI